MTQTLRRELIQTIKGVLDNYYDDTQNKQIASIVADAVLELRAFNNLNPQPLHPIPDRLEARRLNEEEKEKILTAADLAWAIASGGKVVAEDIDKKKIEKEALDTFETDMGCPKNWNWYPAKTSDEAAWSVLREFVIERYKENPKCFEAYKTWSMQDYARGAMGILAIKRNPENFPASWSDFLRANLDYGKKEVKVERDSNDIPKTY